MPQTVLITLSLAGTDTGPFDLYSDADGFINAFEVNVPKASLLAGYTSILVPDAATQVRVKSKGVCTNSVTFPILGSSVSTSTTTSTSTSSTSTSSTSSTSTSTSTTTTATPIPVCYEYNILNASGISPQNASWTDCCTGIPASEALDNGSSINVCSRTEPSGAGLIITGGTVECQAGCIPTTTSTSTSTTTTRIPCDCFMVQNTEAPTPPDTNYGTGAYTNCNGESLLWVITSPLGRVFLCARNQSDIIVTSGNVSVTLISPSNPLYVNCSC